MPVMTSQPAFVGSASWFPGATPPPPGVHTATVAFTAVTPGTYHYLAPVPGHARNGTTAALAVSHPG